MSNLIIAAAQTVPTQGDIGANLQSHKKMIREAALQGVQLIVFPEMSLTGYEITGARKLAFVPNDQRLAPLIELAILHNMVINAGAPICDNSRLYIGSYLIFPDGTVKIYKKQFLHPGEDEVYSGGQANGVFSLGNDVVACAICADFSNPAHPESAAKESASVYIASALISHNGYATDSRILCDHSRTFGMTVLLANYGGPTGGYESAGRSALWENGNLIGEITGDGEALLVASRDPEEWRVRDCLGELYKT